MLQLLQLSLAEMGDLDMIRKMLRDVPADDKPYSVIGIHDIPGSGKTTLTQYVCDK